MSLFQTRNLGKLFNVRKSFSLSTTVCKCLINRNRADVARKFITFDEVMAQRRAEAKRSLVVQVNSEASFTELYGYCSKYASINGIHHYKNNGGEHFMLIEFSTEDSMRDVLHSCATHQKDKEVLPLQSPFLWFRAANDKKEKFQVPEGLSLVTRNCEMEINEEQLVEQLGQCGSMSEQIQTLYDRTTLNDLSVRLRFIVARQIECLFDSMYANVAVFPFGSSVNGFGRLGSDLDLVLTNTLPERMAEPGKRLVYQQKHSVRTSGARALELAAEALEQRAAGAARVARVLHARVPIVKFTHALAGLDCDLCYNNMSGVHMSVLLWQLSALAPRCAALCSSVRRWARAAGVWAPQPGRGLTGFPLTVMLLFFLQGSGVLPPLSALIKRARKEDIYTAEENLNCTFLRDLNELPPDCYGQNRADLETLLIQFFEFYAQFDFHNKAISVIEGVPIRKPNTQPLYIVNPFDPTQNVSRNVSYEECERLQTEVRNAAWMLEDRDQGKSGDWGIIPLLEGKSTRGLKNLLRVGNSHRLVSVKDLFTDDDPKLPETAKENGKEKRPLKFKNTHTASDVYRIRRNKMV